MSQITLKPLDDGQKAVEIPLGKTTIGRGLFLGCSDKKVSRNHAVLEVTNKGEVYLTPTHVNPCFYQPTADSPGQILKKDIPHKLENGDSFSLLPRAYRYQLIVVGDSKDEKDTNQNDSSKQCGKTNGSTGDEINKEPIKGLCSEELGDTIVPEKTSPKEEDLTTTNDKNCAKEENNFSKKITDITDDKKLQFSKENKEVTKEKETTSPKENSSHKAPTEPSQAKEDTPEDICAKDESEVKDEVARTEHSKASDSNAEDSVHSDDQPKSCVDKIVEENESTLHNNSSPKNNSLDDISHDGKSDKQPSEESAEVKRTENCEESRDEGTSSPLPSKEPNTEVEEDKLLPEVTPAKRGRKKPAAAKQPRGDKQVTQRKKAAAPESPPKPRGRKKVPKFEFEPGEEGSSQRQVAGRTSSRTNRQTRQGLSLEDFIVSDDEEWQSDRSEPKQRRKRGSRRGDDSGSDWEVEHKKTKKPIHKVGSGSESGSDWGSHKKKKGGPKGKRKKSKTTASDGGSEDEADQTTVNETKSDKPRIPCTYGKKCYRRNQNHVEQFSHPGDSDYTSEADAGSQKNDAAPVAAASESEPETPKKECPYGANCFRKNPQHKKDFKHTKKVRPQREAAKQADKKAKSSRNSDEVDSYDLNDSFLNDDSDEYKPVDSGSDYESGEKMKRFAKVKGGKNKRGKKV